MGTKKLICSSHINLLRKVSTQLAYKQTMGFSQIILGESNRAKMEEAEKLIYKAINLLSAIE
jgi:hypothetical protein